MSGSVIDARLSDRFSYPLRTVVVVYHITGFREVVVVVVLHMGLVRKPYNSPVIWSITAGSSLEFGGDSSQTSK